MWDWHSNNRRLFFDCGNTCCNVMISAENSFDEKKKTSRNTMNLVARRPKWNTHTHTHTRKTPKMTSLVFGRAAQIMTVLHRDAPVLFGIIAVQFRLDDVILSKVRFDFDWSSFCLLISFCLRVSPTLDWFSVGFQVTQCWIEFCTVCFGELRMFFFLFSKRNDFVWSQLV